MSRPLTNAAEVTLGRLVDWIQSTRVSELIKSVAWIIPATQVIHILTISAVISVVALIHLRNLGVVMRGRPQEGIVRRYVPAVWYGVLLLLLSGIVLIVGEPARELLNAAFQLKMLLIIVVLGLTLLFRQPLRRDPLYWEKTRGRRSAALALSLVSLMIWVGIVFAGRWIAYANS